MRHSPDVLDREVHFDLTLSQADTRQLFFLTRDHFASPDDRETSRADTDRLHRTPRL